MCFLDTNDEAIASTDDDSVLIHVLQRHSPFIRSLEQDGFTS